MSNIKTVDVNEIENISGEVNSLLAQFDHTLSNLSERSSELLLETTEFREYDGAIKLGSNRESVESIYRVKSHEEFKIIGAEEVIHLSNCLIEETDTLLSISNNVRESMRNIEDSAALIAIYIKAIEDTLDENATFLDKIKKASIVMEEDAKNNYEILLTTPILCNGEMENLCAIYWFQEDGKSRSLDHYWYYGPYLKMFTVGSGWAYAPLATVIPEDSDWKACFKEMTDEEKAVYTQKVVDYNKKIYQQSLNYTDKFKDGINKNLTSISYINYSDEMKWPEYCAYTTYLPDKSGADGCRICIPMDQVDPANEISYNFMSETMTHELSHVYDNYLQKEHFQVANGDVGYTYSYTNPEFQNVQSQVNALDPNCDFLRDYGQSQGLSESFAEYATEYFGNGSGPYNPDDLRQIDININNRDMTLYDYMDNILNY